MDFQLYLVNKALESIRFNFALRDFNRKHPNQPMKWQFLAAELKKSEPLLFGDWDDKKFQSTFSRLYRNAYGCLGRLNHKHDCHTFNGRSCCHPSARKNGYVILHITDYHRFANYEKDTAKLYDRWIADRKELKSKLTEEILINKYN